MKNFAVFLFAGCSVLVALEQPSFSRPQRNPDQDRVMMLKALNHLDSYLTRTALKAATVQKDLEDLLSPLSDPVSPNQLCADLGQLKTAAHTAYAFVSGQEQGDLNLWLPEDDSLYAVVSTIFYNSREFDADAPFCRDAELPVVILPIQNRVENMIEQNTSIQNYVQYLIKVVSSELQNEG